MFNRYNNPILEFVGGFATHKKCEKCKIAIFRQDPKETYSYYIGSYCIEVVAYIPKGECPSCGEKWESPDACQMRNDAFRKSIDSFWNKLIEEIGIKDAEMASVMYVVSRLMIKLGGGNRQIASELGRWLANCSFLTH